MEYLIDLGVFLLRVFILTVAVVLAVSAIMAAASRVKRQMSRGTVVVTHLNRELEQMRNTLRKAVLDRFSFRLVQKQEKKRKKAEEQANKKKARSASEKDGSGETAGQSDTEVTSEAAESRRKRMYVIDFKGDIAATQVDSLRHEISTVLSLAEPCDEVVVKLESPGGMVNAYGLASSQLLRVRQRGIPLTVCVDKMAASGGYMMACIADRLIAAPFAMLGSIGVVLQMPNFHKVLQKNDIDFEMVTAGEYKRTLTLFGETTQKARNKVKEDVEDIHELFKSWVKEYRPVVDIDRVSTGEVWFGAQATDRKLIDDVGTSDDYVMSACEDADVYEVRYEIRKNLGERIGKAAHTALDRTVLNWAQRLKESRYFS